MLEFIAILAIIFLSLFGYSAGIVSGSQKRSSIEPGVIDFLLIIIILSAALVSISISDINRWLLVMITFLGSGVIGYLKAVIRRDSKPIQTYIQKDGTSKRKNLWGHWVDFSTRIGAYQSRIILSFVYLLLMFLVALPIWIFSDPMQVKLKTKASYWMKRTEREVLAEALKQY